MGRAHLKRLDRPVELFAGRSIPARKIRTASATTNMGPYDVDLSWRLPLAS